MQTGEYTNKRCRAYKKPQTGFQGRVLCDISSEKGWHDSHLDWQYIERGSGSYCSILRTVQSCFRAKESGNQRDWFSSGGTFSAPSQTRSQPAKRRDSTEILLPHISGSGSPDWMPMAELLGSHRKNSRINIVCTILQSNDILFSDEMPIENFAWQKILV